MLPRARTRPLTIVAQDPAIRVGGRILTTQVEVPVEALAPGPWGHRVHVIDYDASAGVLYEPLTIPPPVDGYMPDPFAASEPPPPAPGPDDAVILGDPKFHAQNVYAIVMRTLARFEFALGRRVSWGFHGHHLKIAPHAFADANAFYSERDQALLFGYFPGRRGTVFSCLSHDVIAHEATHAILDGLRERFTDPSSPDQAGFHEAFADVVALLSVFSLPAVVEVGLDLGRPGARGGLTVRREDVSPPALRQSILLGLAKELGQELSGVRGRALRRSAELVPRRDYLGRPEYEEPHRRGEVLVAAVMNAFIHVWAERLERLGTVARGELDRQRVAEEGAAAADRLLTIAIRALDYTPPVHLEFCDYVSALLTADHELQPDDSRYRFREHLRRSFADYGINPASPVRLPEVGLWQRVHEGSMAYDRTHFDRMQRDPDEVFQFIWENRQALDLCEGAYSRVLSVRPCVRVAPDGAYLRETVAEFTQELTLRASELPVYGISKPNDMPDDTEVALRGGAALVFDEYGRLKYHVHNRLLEAERQTRRLKHLWRYGAFDRGASLRRRFSHLHRLRATDATGTMREEW